MYIIFTRIYYKKMGQGYGYILRVKDIGVGLRILPHEEKSWILTSADSFFNVISLNGDTRIQMT